MTRKPRNKIRQRRRLVDMDMSKVPLKKIDAMTDDDFAKLTDRQQRIAVSRIVESIRAKRIER